MPDRPSAIRLDDPTHWPSRPLLMGIVNVTPDSFSDGGESFRWERAVSRALQLRADGADILDIGGESTRPGARPVSQEEELRRLLPVLRALTGETDAPLSVDTRKPGVAAAALDAGASWVNDVGGLRDPAMVEVVARHDGGRGAGIVVMHMQGDPATMQLDPRYDDVVEEVCGWLADAAGQAVNAGIPPSRIWIDPGIGFGKTVAHNLALLRALDRLASLGYAVVVGASRKGFIGKISGDPVDQRLPGSLAAIEGALGLPKTVLRVHDVAATRQYLQLRRSIEAAEPFPWPRFQRRVVDPEE